MSNYKPYTQLSSFDWVLEAASFLVIVASWLVLLLNFAEIPETVPVHFNMQGEADRFGSKNELFLVQGIASVLYAGMVVLALFPQAHNMPTTLTEENKEEKWKLSAQFIRVVNLVVSSIFLSLTVTSVNNALMGVEDQDPWPLFVLLGVLGVAIVIYWVKLAKK